MHETYEARVEITGCVDFADLFQDPRLEEPPAASASAQSRRQYAALAARASNVCTTCPLMDKCLYDAVVNHDVAGFVAGTTSQQRQQIRERLAITVEPEDFDTIAGVTARHRQIDHDEVLRLRKANPHESLETLANRLGCSLSTVKRHLRRARAEGESTITRLRPAPTITMAQVKSALAMIMHPSSKNRTAA